MPNEIVSNTQQTAKINKTQMRKQGNLIPGHSNSLNSHQLHSQATTPQSKHTQKNTNKDNDKEKRQVRYKKRGNIEKDLVVALSGSEMKRGIKATKGRVLSETWVTIQ